MNEELVKLSKVKKSCKTGRIITKILKIVAIVATMICLVCGIGIIVSGEKFDNALFLGSGNPNYLIDKGFVVMPIQNGFSARITGDGEEVHIDPVDLSDPGDDAGAVGDTEPGILTPDEAISTSGDPIESAAYNLTTAVVKVTRNFTPHMIYGVYLIFIAVLCLAVVIIMHLLTSTFGIIEKEESPFSKNVIKKLTAVFIVISVVLLLTLGWGAGLVMGIITWAIYTIMDYGRILQIQADETL